MNGTGSLNGLWKTFQQAALGFVHVHRVVSSRNFLQVVTSFSFICPHFALWSPSLDPLRSRLSTSIALAMLAFSTTSKMEVVTSAINFNKNLHFWIWNELKLKWLVTISILLSNIKQYKNANIDNLVYYGKGLTTLQKKKRRLSTACIY